MLNKMEVRRVNGGQVIHSAENGKRFVLPILPSGKYGLSQLDDYAHLPRRAFVHQPPLRLRLEARVSADQIPGTWGFGLWNDPFSFGFGGGGMARLLPVLPNAAWFFYGSQQNHLTLTNDQPGSGFHAKVFRSPRLPSILSVLGLPGLPLLLWRVTARFLRKSASCLVKESTKDFSIEVDAWHAYEMLWKKNQVVFRINQEVVMETDLSPKPPLGLVIWIDNQYFKFLPDGKIGFGFLGVAEQQWLDIRAFSVTSEL